MASKAKEENIERKESRKENVVEGFGNVVEHFNKPNVPKWGWALIAVFGVFVVLFLLHKSGFFKGSHNASFSCGMSDMSATPSQEKWQFKFY